MNYDIITVSIIISIVWKIAKFYCKSPLKNQILQQYVQEEHGKNVQLIFDSKTRWNSLSLNKIINIESLDWLQSRIGNILYR